MSDMIAAFPNVGPPYDISSFRSCHPSTSAKATISFNDFGGLTAPTPTMSTLQLGSSSSTAPRLKGTNATLFGEGTLLTIAGMPDDAIMTVQLSNYLDLPSYNGTCTYTSTALPSFVTLASGNGAITVSVAKGTVSPSSAQASFTITNKYGNSTTVPIKFVVALASSALLKFDAASLPSVGSSVSSWVNTGSASSVYDMTAYGAPTVGQTGNYKHVAFARASTQYFNTTHPIEWNWFTSYNGMTAFVVGAYSGSAGNWERWFDMGNGAASDNILLARYTTDSTICAQVFNGSTCVPSVACAMPSDTNFHVYVFNTTNSAAGCTASLYIDNVSNAAATASFTTPIANRTTTANYIGRSSWADAYLNGCIRHLQIVPVSLSGTQMANVYAGIVSSMQVPGSTAAIPSQSLTVNTFTANLANYFANCTAYTASSPATVSGSTLTLVGAYRGSIYSVTVTGSNTNGFSSVSTSFSVTESFRPPALSAVPNQTGATYSSAAYTLALAGYQTATGTGALTWSISGTPPSGTSINSATGVLTVSKTTILSGASVTVAVTNQAVGGITQSAQTTFALTITLPRVTATGSIAAITVSGVITSWYVNNVLTNYFSDGYGGGLTVPSVVATYSGVDASFDGTNVVVKSNYRGTSYSVTVTARDVNGYTATQTFTVIEPFAAPQLSIGTITVAPTYNNTTTINFNDYLVSKTNLGTLTWSLTGYVIGGTFNPTTGILSILNPNNTSSATYLIQVTNPSSLSSNATFTMSISPPAVTYNANQFRTNKNGIILGSTSKAVSSDLTMYFDDPYGGGLTFTKSASTAVVNISGSTMTYNFPDTAPTIATYFTVYATDKALRQASMSIRTVTWTGCVPISTGVTYNTSPWFTDPAATGTWPDNNSVYIWNTSGAQYSASEGSVYFWSIVRVGVDTLASWYIAVDDGCEVTFNDTVFWTTGGWGWNLSKDVTLLRGDNKILCKCTNGGGPAGFMSTIVSKATRAVIHNTNAANTHNWIAAPNSNYGP